MMLQSCHLQHVQISRRKCELCQDGYESVVTANVSNITGRFKPLLPNTTRIDYSWSWSSEGVMPLCRNSNLPAAQP